LGSPVFAARGSQFYYESDSRREGDELAHGIFLKKRLFSKDWSRAICLNFLLASVFRSLRTTQAFSSARADGGVTALAMASAIALHQGRW
jgi:hypothetical protein